MRVTLIKWYLMPKKIQRIRCMQVAIKRYVFQYSWHDDASLNIRYQKYVHISMLFTQKALYRDLSPSYLIKPIELSLR